MSMRLRDTLQTVISLVFPREDQEGKSESGVGRCCYGLPVLERRSTDPRLCLPGWWMVESALPNRSKRIMDAGSRVHTFHLFWDLRTRSDEDAW